MKILITGATGFIGTALCSRLLHDQHDLVVLSRQPHYLKMPLTGINTLSQLKPDDIFDVVINLAGEPIANKRWSEKQKKRITNSRLDITQQLISYFKTTEHKPKILISGSAIGYYGIRQSDQDITETDASDSSFSSQLCQHWEALALQAESLGIRTCLIRTGIVLGKNGGALSKMLPPFKMALGGKIGTGTQWMSWIHINDLVAIILYCIEHDTLHGAINGTAPKPVTNNEFTKTLGKALKRPTVLPLPATIVKLLMGQMGEELLLSGMRILPVKIQQAGYTFKYEDLESALLTIV